MKLLILFILLSFSLNANMNVVCKAGVMDNNSAKKYINKLLKKEPENIEYILKLADVHLKSGEILKGYKYIARAYKINPRAVKDSEISNILSYALEMTDLAKRAKQSNDKRLWNELGDNFFNMGVCKETVTAYENSLALDKNQEDISLKLVLSYKKSNQIYKAVERLKLLLQENSKIFYANYYLAKIFRYSLNDEKLAKIYFTKAKKILINQKGNFASTQYPHLMYDITSELGK
ncbi:MAG: hypothetical protein DRG78_08110 [Epsilonproteobacteria bacterium]|nr:MAG: hypothetical protein DRG78_08110 [Campylobacterota bacterium]